MSEVLPHKRERRKQDRPGELLEAALDLFVEKGFAATRSEEVAARAGVSKGTLFLYFPSKEELFKAVVMENVARPVAEGITEAENFQGDISMLGCNHFDLMDAFAQPESGLYQTVLKMLQI